MKRKINALKQKAGSLLSAVALGMIAGFSQSFTL